MATKTPAAARAEKAEKKTFDVLSPLDHDGERYATGDQVELTTDQAKPLLDLQAVKPATT